LKGVSAVMSKGIVSDSCRKENWRFSKQQPRMLGGDVRPPASWLLKFNPSGIGRRQAPAKGR
jgi:hypothetical protein